MDALKTLTDDDGKTLICKEYNGQHFPSLVPGNVKDQMEGIKNLKIRPDDMFLLTYPRSGSHWLREITNMLQRGEATYIDKSVVDSPFEFIPQETVDNMTSPRIFYTHLKFEYLPEEFISRKRKCINLTRNPKDSAVSLFVLLTQVTDGFKGVKEPAYTGSWSEFLKMFYRGDMPTGGFHEYLRDIERVKQELKYPILIIYYEDLIEEPVREIKKMADFMEVTYTDELISDIAKKCQFSNIKRQKSDNLTDFSKEVSTDGSEVFYRKGKVGDWKNWFTVAQNEEFNKWYTDGLTNSIYNHRFTL